MTTADIRMDQSGNIYEFVQNVKTIICLIVKCAEIQKIILRLAKDKYYAKI